LYEIEKEKEEDSKLKEARKMVKEMADPYAESKLNETAKIKFLCYVLEGRGSKI
jgi:hypothetical protein